MSAEQPVPEPVATPSRHPVLVYTGLRALLLVAVGGVLYLIGVRGVWLLLFAFLLSGVVSVFVLDRRREVAAAEVVGAVQRVNHRIDASATAEDDGPAGDAAPASVPAPAAPVAAPRSRHEIPADDDLDDLEPGAPGTTGAQPS